MSRTTPQPNSATDPSDFFHGLFDSAHYREALQGALDDTNSWEKRSCPLAASLVATLVVAMSLFRHLSIPNVFRQIRSWYPRTRFHRRLARLTDEAFLHAKQRLGISVMVRLFDRLARKVYIPHTFHGLRVFGVDGVKLSVPDTKANESYFGRCRSSNGATTAFPQLLAVCMVAARTRQVMAVEFDRYDAGERRSCESFLEFLDDRSLVILDRGLYAVWLFRRFLAKGVHFLCRASTSYKIAVLEKLGDGDYLVAVSARFPAPRENHWIAGQKFERVYVTLRMIEYRVGRRERVRLITDLTDPQTYPALELAHLYHARWECELAFDEIKTHLAGAAHGNLQLPFRSRNPELVLQEAYGLFVAYNLIRTLICDAARRSSIPPTEISFLSSLHLIRSAMRLLEVLPNYDHPRLIQTLMREISRSRLKRSRRPRRYPRVVRVKIIRFPRRRSWHSQTIVNEKARLRLVNRISATSFVR